jgi:hypothetical protein
MTALTDSISQTLTPQTLGQIGKKIGVDEATMQTGLDAAVPAVLGSLGKTASTPGGLDDLMSQLPQPTDGSDPLSSVLGGLLGGGAQAPAGDMSGLGPLGALVGPAVGVVGTVLSRKLGFDISPILTMGVPIVLGAIARRAKQQKLDKAGVAQLIADENKAFVDKGGPNAELVQSALKAGDDALVLKAKFTDAAWNNVRLSPLAASKLVIMASKSNPIAMAEELKAGADAVGTAVRDVDPASVLGFAFGSKATEAEMDMVMKADQNATLGIIRDAAAAVSKNSPGEVAAYKTLLSTTGQKVAEAAKEGGFLGIGGVKVSKEEQAVLDQIRGILG